MSLDRRMVLRGALAGGAATVLPLPRLGAMFNGNGNAYADGSPVRRTFGTWFFGNGVIPDRWIPKGEGRAFPLSDQLAPLVNVKKKLTVVSGMQLKTGRQSAHSYGTTGALTGAKEAPGGTVQLPTIDQVVADLIAGDTPLRSLQVGVTKATPRTHGDMYFCSSFGGPNKPNFPDLDPASVFTRLFGGGLPRPPAGSMPAPADTKLPSVRQSVLDAVKADAQELSARLGREDRLRLEDHLDGIRALERRLRPPPPSAGCQKPAAAPDVAPDAKDEARPELNKAMADLTVLALSCNLTNVFAFMFSYPAAHVHFRHLGAGNIQNDFHNTLCHAEGGAQPSVHMGVVYEMQCFAYLLEQLDRVQEGDHTLLDNSCVLTSTCVAWGKTHQREEWPIMIGGLAGGGLKGDLHYRAPMDNPTKVLLTLANLYGASRKDLGKDALLASDEVSAIKS
jgi:hypothetical protein